jgi:CDP-diacylglycerol---glycerol-3-phosphate 3-phosphatidyltransferase
MNAPNILTMSRIILAVVMVYLLEQGSAMGNLWAAIVFTVASLTDFCDGYLARTKGLVSVFGKIMDPVADKVLILSALGVLAHLGTIPWWIFVVIAVREIAVTVSRLLAMRKGQALAAESAGKAKTVVQIIAVLAVLLYLTAGQSSYCASWFPNVQKIWSDINYDLMLAAVVLTVYSGIEYFWHKK